MLHTAYLFQDIYQLFATCFTEDTLVATEDGHVAIKDIEIGDKVWAYNAEIGCISEQKSSAEKLDAAF